MSEHFIPNSRIHEAQELRRARNDANLNDDHGDVNSNYFQGRLERLFNAMSAGEKAQFSDKLGRPDDNGFAF